MAVTAGLEMTATEELRVRIHQHLRRYPGLTAYEIGRALGVPAPKGTQVRNQLRRMEDDGEVTRSSGKRAADDPRPAIRWRAS